MRVYFDELQINDFRLFKKKTIKFGKLLTVISGRNATGKSTILGMIGNSCELKKKDGVTVTSKSFKADFSELFKGSEKFDTSGSDRFTVTLVDENGNEYSRREFRTAWQKLPLKKSEIDSASKNLPDKKRFRVIPRYIDPNTKHQVETKLNYPVLYLGLSRLFPVGESKDQFVKNKHVILKEEEKCWFIKEHSKILSEYEINIKDITNYSISETDKKSGVGINTDDYDYLTNSSGQDNIGQILLAILSFKRLKEHMGNDWRGGILLVDELDATLHPAAQLKLLELLLHEAKHTNIQIVFTTHSTIILKEICEKIQLSRSKDSEDIYLHYFTTANKILDCFTNPDYTMLDNDLKIISQVQNNFTIKIYSEDDEARWVLSRLLKKYDHKIELINFSAGCKYLLNLYDADEEYFKNNILILDGDFDLQKEVKDKNTKKSNDLLSKIERYKNIICLPGKVRPETLVYDYLSNLSSEHKFWSKARKYDITWTYLMEHSPQDHPENKKDRDVYKEWFNKHKYYFDKLEVIDMWINDNKSTYEAFLNNFKTAYNAIAKRNMQAELSD